MTIAPITGIESITKELNAMQPQIGQSESTSFLDVFRNALDNVNETDEMAKQSEMLVATGGTDDLHTLMINTSKAELALETMVQIRNKALDAYNEIMKITL